jgi:hypothetical protein
MIEDIHHRDTTDYPLKEKELDMSKRKIAGQMTVAKKTARTKKPQRKSPSKSSATTAHQRPKRDPRHPAVGTVLKRQFKGCEVEVQVTGAGFQYEDHTFRSLSAVARRITGYMISGPVFFNLVDPQVATKREE